jgi:DNA polymerase alpha-associated DNA helicase A
MLLIRGMSPHSITFMTYEVLKVYRMNQTMTRLEKTSDSEMSSLTSILFGHTSVTPVSDADLKALESKIKWTDDLLNESQKTAVLFALASPEIALIHGPPGTGKTHTLITIILQLLKQDKRILVCGPSNVSVDNICDRLAPYGVNMVRLGHPARLLPSVLNHSLDVLTHTSDAGGIVKDIRRDMDEIQASLRKKKTYSERRVAYGELKTLRNEFREREKKCISDLVRGSKVVLATLHGAGGWQLNNDRFDIVIVDEASQALEAQTWIPLLWGAAKKLILAGDHLQLPPTIKSINTKTTDGEKTKKAEEKGEGFTLERTLFDRLLDLHGDKIKKMLTTQYRMHEKIMAFPSSELYKSKLVAAASVKDHLLTDLPYQVEDTDETREPLVFYDTQGDDFPETAEEEDTSKKKLSLGDSKSNAGEAAIAKKHVAALVDAGVLPSDIAVITPYNAQLALLSRMLKDEFAGIELGSVDGFQGREKEAVIVSLVRSGGEVGFLAEKRRLNGEL